MEKSKHEGDADKLEEKYKELQQTIQRNESIIHMLKMQIQQLQNKEPSVADSVS
jgi:predicted RNase H-like nuclease (RuvC/YqgF family)